MQKTDNINNQAKSYLAKLLATENISVEHKKVQTAYFDVKSRLLVLPIWKHMNNDITDLLISHEVGHALFTPQSGWEKSVIEKKIPIEINHKQIFLSRNKSTFFEDDNYRYYVYYKDYKIKGSQYSYEDINNNLDINSWPISTRSHSLKGGHYVFFKTSKLKHI